MSDEDAPAETDDPDAAPADPEAPEDDAPDGEPIDDPVSSALFGLAGHPGRALALGAAALLVVFYAVVVQQALFLLIWLAVTGLLLYLAWRFVSAHERIAGAAERLADRD